jgi:hypothetical protein
MEMWELVMSNLGWRDQLHLDGTHPAFLGCSLRANRNIILDQAINQIEEIDTCEPTHTSLKLPVGYEHRLNSPHPTSADRMVVLGLVERRPWVIYSALCLSNHPLELQLLYKVVLEWVATASRSNRFARPVIRCFEKQLAWTFARHGNLDVVALLKAFASNPNVVLRQLPHRLEFRAERVVPNAQPYPVDRVDLLMEALSDPSRSGYGAPHFFKPNAWFSAYASERSRIAYRLIVMGIERLIERNQHLQYTADDDSGPVQPPAFSFYIDRYMHAPQMFNLMMTFPWRIGQASTEATLVVPIETAMASRLVDNPIEALKTGFACQTCQIIPNNQNDAAVTVGNVPLHLLVQWVSDITARLYEPPPDFAERAAAAVRREDVTCTDLLLLGNVDAKMNISFATLDGGVFGCSIYDTAPTFEIRTKQGHPVAPDYNIKTETVMQLLSDEHPEWVLTLVPEIDDDGWSVDIDEKTRVAIFRWVAHIIGKETFY